MKDDKQYSIARYVEEQINPKVYCKFCNRELKTPKSKECGYGPSCYNKWVKSRAYKRRLI